MRNSYYLVVGEFKISITIRRSGKKYKTLSGRDLVRKVTKRAIERFLCEVFGISYPSFISKEIEYQPVFFRTSKKSRAVKIVRVKRKGDSSFTIITVGQMNHIGVTEDQFLGYLHENSTRISPVPGMLSSIL